MRTHHRLGVVLASALIMSVPLATPVDAQSPPEADSAGEEANAALAPGCDSTNPPPLDYNYYGGTWINPGFACIECAQEKARQNAIGWDGYCWQTASIGSLDVSAELWLRSRPPVNMESIPGTDGREGGWAYSGDMLIPICWMPDNHNLSWVLAINRNGHGGIQYQNTVGFVPWNTRRWDRTVWDCYPSVTTTITTSVFQVDLESIPGTDGREGGVARPGQELWAMCTLNDNHNVRWDLVINRSGIEGIQHPNSVGFVEYRWTADSYSLPTCPQ